MTIFKPGQNIVWPPAPLVCDRCYAPMVASLCPPVLPPILGIPAPSSLAVKPCAPCQTRRARRIAQARRVWPAALVVLAILAGIGVLNILHDLGGI